MVVDVEATCGPPDAQIDRREREVIELGVVAVDADSGAVLGEWSSLVRPLLRPALSAYCTELTGIRQADVDGAGVFSDTWARLGAWEFLNNGRSRTFCAWGGFDRRILARECRRHGLPWLLGRQHIDLRKAFSRTRRRRWESHGLRAAAELVGLAHLGGHRALPDARTAAALLPWCLPGRSFSASGARELVEHQVDAHAGD